MCVKNHYFRLLVSFLSCSCLIFLAWVNSADAASETFGITSARAYAYPLSGGGAGYSNPLNIDVDFVQNDTYRFSTESDDSPENITVVLPEGLHLNVPPGVQESTLCPESWLNAHDGECPDKAQVGIIRFHTNVRYSILNIMRPDTWPVFFNWYESEIVAKLYIYTPSKHVADETNCDYGFAWVGSIPAPVFEGYGIPIWKSYRVQGRSNCVNYKDVSGISQATFTIHGPPNSIGDVATLSKSFVVTDNMRMQLGGSISTNPQARRFVSYPALCHSPARVVVTAQAYSGRAATANDSFAINQCNTAPFESDAILGPETVASRHVAEPVPWWAGLSFDHRDLYPALSGRFQSPVRAFKVDFGQAEFSPGVLQGIVACKANQFAQYDKEHYSNCPANSAIADVFLEDANGWTDRGVLYLGAVKSGSGNEADGWQVNVYMQTYDKGKNLLYKNIGRLIVAPSGNVTLRFGESEDLPYRLWSQLNLRFTRPGQVVDGEYVDGPKLLANPTSCGPDQTPSVTMTPWSEPGKIPSSRDVTLSTPTPNGGMYPAFSFEKDGSGGCPSVLPLTPKITAAKTAKDKAGTAHSWVSVLFERPAYDAQIRAVTINYPVGLRPAAGKSFDSFATCNESDVATTGCPTPTVLGSAKLEFGFGDELLETDGAMIAKRIVNANEVEGFIALNTDKIGQESPTDPSLGFRKIFLPVRITYDPTQQRFQLSITSFPRRFPGQNMLLPLRKARIRFEPYIDSYFNNPSTAAPTSYELRAETIDGRISTVTQDWTPN